MGGRWEEDISNQPRHVDSSGIRRIQEYSIPNWTFQRTTLFACPRWRASMQSTTVPCKIRELLHQHRTPDTSTRTHPVHDCRQSTGSGLLTQFYNLLDPVSCRQARWAGKGTCSMFADIERLWSGRCFVRETHDRFTSHLANALTPFGELVIARAGRLCFLQILTQTF